MSSDDSLENGEAGGRITFAFKLFEVANDGQLIRWNSGGDGVIVDQYEYEQFVQDLYPGFVQTSSFLNLRRLFRDYNFTCRVLRRKKPHGSKVEFCNPFFRRNDFENLKNIKAKERIYKFRISSASSSHSIYRTRRKYTRRFPTRTVVNLKVRNNRGTGHMPFYRRSMDHFYDTNNVSNDSCLISEQNTTMPGCQSLQPYKDDLFKLFQLFAVNELPEEIYMEIILRRFGDQLAHLADGPFDELVKTINDLMTPEMSPYSGVYYEIPLSEM